MQVTITPIQAAKLIAAIHAMYEGKNDPEMEELIASLSRNLESGPEQKCSVCGATIPPEPAGQIRENREYCSDRCRQQGYRERNTARRRKASRAQANSAVDK